MRNSVIRRSSSFFSFFILLHFCTAFSVFSGSGSGVVSGVGMAVELGMMDVAGAENAGAFCESRVEDGCGWST